MQPRIAYRVFGYYVPDPTAPARGNDRFITCACGWLVNLNRTGNAGGRRTDYRDPTTACTNYHCTGKKDHKSHRKRYVENQLVYHANISAGTARLIELTDELLPIPPPPTGRQLAPRWAQATHY